MMANGHLQFHIVAAKNIPKNDPLSSFGGGKSDAYVTVNCNSIKGVKNNTKKINDAVNPIWEQIIL